MSESEHLSQEILELYLDRELESTQLRSVKAHLDQCAQCRQKLDETQSLFAMIGFIPELPLKRDLSPRILAGIGHRRALPRTMLVLALAQLLVVLSVLLLGWPLSLDFSRLGVFLNAVETVSLTELFSYLGQLGETLLATLQQIPLPPELPELLSGIVLPVFAWMSIMLAAGLLWLGMNGLLLSGIKDQESRSGMEQ